MGDGGVHRGRQLTTTVAVTAALWSLGSVVDARSQSRSVPTFRLAPVWRVSVGGPVRHRTIYQLAVCHDGSSYFTDSRGRIVHLTPEGETSLATSTPDAHEAHAAACRPDGNLTVATPGAVVSFNRVGDGLAVVQRIASTVASLTVVDEALVGVGYDARLRPVLVRLSLPGLEPAAPETLTVMRSVPATGISQGALFWDGQRLGYVPARRYEIHTFDRDGRPLGFETRADPTFRGMPPAPWAGQARPTDYVSAFIPLGTDRYLSFVVKYDDLSPGYSRSHTALEMLDGRLRLTGAIENDKVFGLPAGAAADGDVLFFGVTPEGSWVTRARLVEGGH